MGKQLARTPFDLIVLDLMCPVRTAERSLCRRLRAAVGPSHPDADRPRR